jgi:hypothetical protein
VKKPIYFVARRSWTFLTSAPSSEMKRFRILHREGAENGWDSESGGIDTFRMGVVDAP